MTADFKPTHRHLKRGSLYQVIATGTFQTAHADLDNALVVIYRDASGHQWVRPAEEFVDGRFAELRLAPEGYNPDIGAQSL